jgi:integrin alpha FG-GAP repeat containing protein 1
MVFMTCDSVAQSGIGSNCVLNVVYNIQLPVCASSTSPSIINGQRVCRPLDALCMRDPSFHFDLSRSSNNVYVPFHHGSHTVLTFA